MQQIMMKNMYYDLFMMSLNPSIFDREHKIV